MAPTIPDGFALIAGRGRDNARAALAAAEAAGLEPNVVRATTGGYLVPEKVLDFYDTGEVVTVDDGAADGADAGETPDGATGEGDDGASTETVETTTETETAETVEAAVKTVEQPPKSGAGSGEEAWVEWATAAHSYDPAEGLSRNEIIAKFAS